MAASFCSLGILASRMPRARKEGGRRVRSVVVGSASPNRLSGIKRRYLACQLEITKGEQRRTYAKTPPKTRTTRSTLVFFSRSRIV